MTTPHTPVRSAPPDRTHSHLRLGLDIGGTKAALAVGRGDELVASERFEHWSHGDWRRDLAALIECADSLLDRAGADSTQLAAVGISSPGPLDVPNGRIVEAHNIPGWSNVPIVEELRRHFGVPVTLENDANASALAEWQFGAGRGTRTMLFATMSSGVGGGLILEGRIHRGSSCQAGEIGHIPIELGGRQCTCGLRGCLEAYTGGHAIASIIREELAAGAESSIRSNTQGAAPRVDAEAWVEAIRTGDRYALGLRERYLDRLAQGLATLISTLDPECVVLGTIIQQNPELFLEPLTQRVRQATWKEFHHVRIEPGQLGRELPFYAGLCAAGPFEQDEP